MPDRDCTRAVVAATPSGCAEALIALWVLSSSGPSGAAADLLTLKPLSQRMAYLQQALRFRRATLAGMLDERWAPLVVFRAPDIDVVRLGAEETISEALMRAVAREYLNVDAPLIASTPSLRPARLLKRELREVLRRLPPLPTTSGRVRVFGRSLCFGI